MIFGGVDKKIEKCLEDLKSRKSENHMRALETLEKILKSEPMAVKRCIPQMVNLVNRGAERVRKKSLFAVTNLSRRRESLRKFIISAIIKNVKEYGIKQIEILELMKNSKAYNSEEFDEIKEDVLNAINDKCMKDVAVALLRKAGLPIEAYLKNMRKYEKEMSEFKDCTAEKTKIEWILKSCKDCFLKGYESEMIRNFEFLMTTLNNIKKVGCIIRIKKKMCDIVRIANLCKFFVFVCNKKDMHLYNEDGKQKWRLSFKGEIKCIEIIEPLKAMLVGTSDGYVYSIDYEGNVKWHYRTVSPVCVITHSYHNIFIGAEDGSVHILDVKGKLVGRHWMDRALWRLKSSLDGDCIIASYHDHTIYSYDKNLFLRWRYMGGIWNDLTVTGDGEYILAVSQGGDLHCISKIGNSLWKRYLERPILVCSASQKGDNIIIYDEVNIISYDKHGKQKWKWKIPRKIRDISIDPSGLFIGIVFDNGIIIAHDREYAFRVTQDVPVILQNARHMGIYINDFEEKFEKAFEHFRNNDYSEGTEIVVSSLRKLESEKRNKIEKEIKSVRAYITSIKNTGADTSRAEDMLRNALRDAISGDLEKALTELMHAKNEAEIARRVMEEVEMEKRKMEEKDVRDAIQHVTGVIDEAVEYGIDPSKFEEILHRTIKYADNGEYKKALTYTKKLEEIVKREMSALPDKIENKYKSAMETLKKKKLTKKEIEHVRDELSSAVVYYEKTGDLKKLAECYEKLGEIEEKRGKVTYAKFLYQKAINAYFKIGEIDTVLMILMDKVKKLEAVSEKTYDYTIEDIFLIYYDGRLIAHNTRRLKPAVDNQVLGGMLVAIQNFVSESFREDAEVLNELRYGKTKILIERGNYIFLAVVLSGQVPEEFRDKMRNLITDVEDKYVEILKEWDGDVSKLWGAKKMLDSLIIEL